MTSSADSGPRRYRHDAPSGWHVSASGFRTLWSPDDSSLPGTITVWPATPIDGGARYIDNYLAQPDGEYAAAGPLLVCSLSGLRGELWELQGERADGAPVRCDLVVLDDGRFRYAMRLETCPQLYVRHAADFFDIVHSVQPVHADHDTQPERR